MSIRISRAAFIKGLAGTGLLAASGKFFYDRQHAVDRIPCRMLGPSRRLGHMLRDGQIRKGDNAAPMPAQVNPAPVQTGSAIAQTSSATAQTSSAIAQTSSRPSQTGSARKKVVIVGGGMAGLSAAWWLEKQGMNDFVLLELEERVGGNSTWGKNSISAFPWGAHYVPVANDESKYVRALFEELGIIESYDSSGLPVYNELYLCHDPQERLLKDGRFQEGLVPRIGLQPDDQAEIARFFKIVYDYRKKGGSDGKPAFAIPLDLSSQDPEIIALDQLSMADWLAKNAFKSQPLLWYINYCCRDDYGSTADKVSAWAGLHYFAGRTGKAANSEAYSVVTWPEGNGFLVQKLKEKNQARIVTGAMVVTVEAGQDYVVTTYMQTSSKKQFFVESDYLIFAAPRFLSKYMVADYKLHDQADHTKLSYAPWMVANISLRRLPESKGEAIAWDNVSYYSDSLGYVVATHQNITTRAGASVITYYFPLSDASPEIARAKLLNSKENEWREKIVNDLEKMHRGITEDIISIDLWSWGHGMIRPAVGFLWGEARKKMKEGGTHIFFAHSDMSGMSNFEEAQYHGVEAARRVLARLEQT